jgi:hypothetical protein
VELTELGILQQLTTSSLEHAFTPTAGQCATTASIIINVTTINQLFSGGPICSELQFSTTSNNELLELGILQR